MIAYVGGSCSPNPGKGSYGYSIHEFKKIIVEDNGISSSYTTSNASEYLAIIKLLDKAKALNISNLQVCSSNRLVVEQINKQTKINALNLSRLSKKVFSLISDFKSVKFSYVSPKQNKGLKLAQQIFRGPCNRKERALELIENTFIKTGDIYLYLKKDGYYEVDNKMLTCTCPDQQNRGGLCKHLMAVLLLEERYPKFFKGGAE